MRRARFEERGRIFERGSKHYVGSCDRLVEWLPGVELPRWLPRARPAHGLDLSL